MLTHQRATSQGEQLLWLVIQNPVTRSTCQGRYLLLPISPPLLANPKHDVAQTAAEPID